MQLSDNARGVLFMSSSMACFTINDTAVKAATLTLPLFELIAIRGAIAVIGLVLIGLVLGQLNVRLPRPDIGYIALRVFAEVCATLTFLLALMQMPLANLSAIMQFTPLAVTLAAAVVFRRRIGWRRLTAILVGLVGVLLIIRPGPSGFETAALLGLISVGFVVMRDLASAKVSRATSSVTVSIWSALAVTIVGIIGAFAHGWQQPDAHEAGLAAIAAGFLVVGYISAVAAMRVGDIAVVAPFRYTALLWAIFLGWLFYDTLPDQVTMVGAALVVATGIYTFWREARLRAIAAT